MILIKFFGKYMIIFEQEENNDIDFSRIWKDSDIYILTEHQNLA